MSLSRKSRDWPQFLIGLAALTAIASISPIALAQDEGVDSATNARPARPDPRSCGYVYEWIEVARFPVQPTNGWASYTYLIQAGSMPPKVGYVMKGKFPHGTYTSWAIYDDELNWTDGTTGSAIEPDPGHENPYRRGTPMLVEKRDFSILMAPPNAHHLATELQSIENRLDIPTHSKFWIMVVRLYGALPRFNKGGYGGPGHLLFPQTVAVDLRTGEEMDCPGLNAVGSPPQDRADMPSGPGGAASLPLLPSLGEKLFLGGPTVPPFPVDTPVDDLFRPRTCGTNQDHFIHQCAPTFDSELIQFSRPPLGPGAAPGANDDDQCSGYLGAAIEADQIGLLRIPRIPSFLSNKGVTISTRYRQKDVQFYGLTMYGAGLGIYFREHTDSPFTNSIGNEEFKPDRYGGSTILLWPRRHTIDQRRLLFDYAKEKGWVVMRNGVESNFTTSNLLLREKGAAKRYRFGYEEQGLSDGVPCFFNDRRSDLAWTAIEEVSHYEFYLANPQNMGPAAPQGVYCLGVDDVLQGDCEKRLRRYIRSTGGSYQGRIPRKRPGR